jgi:hypothetical protein
LPHEAAMRACIQRWSWGAANRRWVMKGFVDNIKELTIENDDFERVLYTGKNI